MKSIARGTNTFLALCAAAVTISACATTKPPTNEVSASQQAIRQAGQSGAGQFAPVELRTAEKKLEQAQAALKEKDYHTARRLAQQASVDAELAQITARAAKAEQAVREIRETIRALQEEISRRQGS